MQSQFHDQFYRLTEEVLLGGFPRYMCEAVMSTLSQLVSPGTEFPRYGMKGQLQNIWGGILHLVIQTRINNRFENCSMRSVCQSLMVTCYDFMTPSNRVLS